MDFIVTGFPRSGTTWLANLLTSDSSICHHDPLYHSHYTDFEDLPVDPGSKLGISCTGIWRWAEWLNDQNCTKIILRRDFSEVQKELHRLGLPYLDVELKNALDSIEGEHYPYTDIFKWEHASQIYYQCVGKPLSKVRFDSLLKINMQPNNQNLHIDKEVAARLYSEILEQVL